MIAIFSYTKQNGIKAEVCRKRKLRRITGDEEGFLDFLKQNTAPTVVCFLPTQANQFSGHYSPTAIERIQEQLRTRNSTTNGN